MEKIPQSTRYNMLHFSKTDHMEWNFGDLLEAHEKELDVLEGHVPIMRNPQQRGSDTGKPPQQLQQQNWPKQQQGTFHSHRLVFWQRSREEVPILCGGTSARELSENKGPFGM